MKLQVKDLGYLTGYCDFHQFCCPSDVVSYILPLLFQSFVNVWRKEKSTKLIKYEV